MAKLTYEEVEEIARRQAAGEDDLIEENLNALYDYFLDSGEMPYGVAKARTGDPSSWIYDKLESWFPGR